MSGSKYCIIISSISKEHSIHQSYQNHIMKIVIPREKYIHVHTYNIVELRYHSYKYVAPCTPIVATSLICSFLLPPRHDFISRSLDYITHQLLLPDLTPSLLVHFISLCSRPNLVKELPKATICMRAVATILIHFDARPGHTINEYPFE